MTTADDRDKQIAKLIRQEIGQREANIEASGLNLANGGRAYVMARSEINGLRKALSFIDPNPYK